MKPRILLAQSGGGDIKLWHVVRETTAGRSVVSGTSWCKTVCTHGCSFGYHVEGHCVCIVPTKKTFACVFVSDEWVPDRMYGLTACTCTYQTF